MNGESPLYVLKPEKSRILIPNAVKLILLSIVFYVGIAININLLELYIPEYANILIIIVLFILVSLESILTFTKLSKIQYRFYPNRMEVTGPKPQYMMYANVMSVNSSQGFLDRMFRTGTIDFGTYKMKAIPNLSQNTQYMKQLIQSIRGQYR